MACRQGLSVKGEMVKMDIRGSGGMLLSPPTSLQRGGGVHYYEWLSPLGRNNLAAMPAWLVIC